MKAVCYIFLFLSPIFLAGQDLFTKPASSFIHHPDEKIVDLEFKGKSIEFVQKKIDDTRLKESSAIIRITLIGVFNITDAPLRLSDKMMLYLENSIISAKENYLNAQSLISISGAERVSITAIGKSILEGNNNTRFGIDISSSGKIHIDNIAFQNFLNNGIYYSGRGLDESADVGSVTRCTFDNCKKYGVLISKSFQFVFADNQIQSCGIGVGMNSDYACVSNNHISKCGIGYITASQYEAVTYNTVIDCDTAFLLGVASKESLIAYNKVKHNGVGFKLLGKSTKVYNNDCDNSLELMAGGLDNQVFANKGILSNEIKNVEAKNITEKSESIIYFNPPLSENEHMDLIKIGKGRFDIFLNDAPLNTVRALIDKAHQEKPESVIVAHLIGNINTVSATDSLLVKDDECILLNGTISGTGSNPNIIFFKEKIVSSFSGGTINGQHLNVGSKNSFNALMYVTGKANVIIDHVTLLNSAAEGITKRNSNEATYINACMIDSCRRRGIWQLASDRLIAFNNTTNRTLMDGIDLDAYTSNSVVMKNVSMNNKRHGVFIEEGAHHHLVIGNKLTFNNTGIHFFNKEVDLKHTSNNLAAFNICNDNNRGISLNAADERKATIGNTLFNNICENNKDVGLGGLYNNLNTTRNYIALMFIKGNLNGDFYPKADLESNKVWSILK
jgi:hypothetical protein